MNSKRCGVQVSPKHSKIDRASTGSSMVYRSLILNSKMTSTIWEQQAASICHASFVRINKRIAAEKLAPGSTHLLLAWADWEDIVDLEAIWLPSFTFQASDFEEWQAAVLVRIRVVQGRFPGRYLAGIGMLKIGLSSQRFRNKAKISQVAFMQVFCVEQGLSGLRKTRLNRAQLNDPLDWKQSTHSDIFPVEEDLFRLFDVATKLFVPTFLPKAVGSSYEGLYVCIQGEGAIQSVETLLNSWDSMATRTYFLKLLDIQPCDLLILVHRRTEVVSVDSDRHKVQIYEAVARIRYDPALHYGRYLPVPRNQWDPPYPGWQTYRANRKKTFYCDPEILAKPLDWFFSEEAAGRYLVPSGPPACIIRKY